jgi:hypothetical protein
VGLTNGENGVDDAGSNGCGLNAGNLNEDRVVVGGETNLAKGSGSGNACPKVELVECWIDSGAPKENPEDVASAIFGPCWPNADPVEGEGLPSVAGWPGVNPADVAFSAGFVVRNENPPLRLSNAFLFVLKLSSPLAPWLEGWPRCPNAKPLPEFPLSGDGDGNPKPVPVPASKEKAGLELLGI